MTLDRKECEHLIGAVAADLADTAPDRTLPVEWCKGWDAALREHAEPLAEQLKAAIAEIDRLRSAGHRAVDDWSNQREADLDEAAETYQAMVDLVAHVGNQLDDVHIKNVRLQDEVAALTERQAKHLQMIASLSQSTPLQSELEGWEGQRAALLAEVGTLRAKIAESMRGPGDKEDTGDGAYAFTPGRDEP